MLYTITQAYDSDKFIFKPQGKAKIEDIEYSSDRYVFKVSSTNNSHGSKCKDNKKDYIVKDHNDNKSSPNKREVTKSPRYEPYHDVTIRNYNKQHIYKSNYILNAAKYENYPTKRNTDLTASWINGHGNTNNVLSYKYGLVYPLPYTYAPYILKDPHTPQTISQSSPPPFISAVTPCPSCYTTPTPSPYRNHKNPLYSPGPTLHPFQIISTPAPYPPPTSRSPTLHYPTNPPLQHYQTSFPYFNSHYQPPPQANSPASHKSPQHVHTNIQRDRPKVFTAFVKH